jgi:hypothetical protein
MKVENLLKILDVYKAGTIIRLKWERDVSSAKAKKQNIQVIKKSSGLIRTDIDYNSLAAVREKSQENFKRLLFNTYRRLI